MLKRLPILLLLLLLMPCLVRGQGIKLPSTPGDVNLKNVFSVTENRFGAKGDGSDDTAAINRCITAANAVHGTVYFPMPLIYYRVTDTLTTVGAGTSVRGPPTGGNLNKILITLDAAKYGHPIFIGDGNSPLFQNLSGQYGPSSFLASPVSIGDSTITLISTAGMKRGDSFILGQGDTAEQFIALNVSGNVVSLAVANSFTQTPPVVGNPYSWRAGAATLAHNAGEWIRNKPQLGLPGNIDAGVGLDGEPQRDTACFIYLRNGNWSGVENCACDGMVTGIKVRGVAATNLTNLGVSIDHFDTKFVDYGILFKLGDYCRITHTRHFEICHSQDGHNSPQTGDHRAPAHGIYVTGSTTQRCSHSIISHIQVFGHNPGPDCSGIKIKFSDGGVFSDFTVGGCPRCFDFEQLKGCSVSNLVGSDFYLTEDFDSQAAAISAVDCQFNKFSNVTIRLFQPDGVTGVDIPVVFCKSSNGSVLSYHNSFTVDAWTSYSTAMVTGAFRLSGSASTYFIGCKHVDGGSATTWFDYDLSYNSTLNVGCDNSGIVNPMMVGTNVKLVYIDNPIANVVLSGDPNLLPAGFTISDTNTPSTTLSNLQGFASLNLLPVSTSATILKASEPANFAGELIRFNNSAGQPEIKILNNTSGNAGQVSFNLWSSSNNIAFFNTGYNATATFPSAAFHTMFGGYLFGAGGITQGTGSAGMIAVATDTPQSAMSLGTDILFQTILSGTTTVERPLRLYNNGDALVGVVSPTTTQTGGFLTMGATAGIPTGVPAGHSGTRQFAYDSTDNVFYYYNTSTSKWQPVNGFKAATPANTGRDGNGANATQVAIGVQTVNTISATGPSYYSFPDPATCAGSEILFLFTNPGGTYTANLIPLGTGPPSIIGHDVSTSTATINNVAGVTVYSINNGGGIKAFRFVSNGTNWYQSN